MRELHKNPYYKSNFNDIVCRSNGNKSMIKTTVPLRLGTDIKLKDDELDEITDLFKKVSSKPSSRKYSKSVSKSLSKSLSVSPEPLSGPPLPSNPEQHPFMRSPNTTITVFKTDIEPNRDVKSTSFMPVLSVPTSATASTPLRRSRRIRQPRMPYNVSEM
jgi:hypothetical protein